METLLPVLFPTLVVPLSWGFLALPGMYLVLVWAACLTSVTPVFEDGSGLAVARFVRPMCIDARCLVGSTLCRLKPIALFVSSLPLVPPKLASELYPGPVPTMEAILA